MRKNEPSLQYNPLEKYKKVDDETRQVWEAGLSKLKDDLSQSASDYVAEQRERSAKTAQLSHTRMLG